jgi:hypothetical protein
MLHKGVDPSFLGVLKGINIKIIVIAHLFLLELGSTIAV